MDHLLGIVWMMRVICQFMNHGEYKGKANIYAHDEVIAILREMSDKLLQKRKQDLLTNDCTFFQFTTVKKG